MGNASYNGTLANAGETRFIFTLINPVTGDIVKNDNELVTNGGDAKQCVQFGTIPNNTTIDLYDWDGMNVIFEYKNVATNICQIRDLAIQWANLSNTTLYPDFIGAIDPAKSQAYNTALQVITDKVVLANAIPSAPNSSAIARIRTNEKILALTNAGGGFGPIGSWDIPNWEYRQFEVNNTSHLLEIASVNNVPAISGAYY